MRPTYHYTLLLVALVIALTVSGRTSAAPVPQPSRPGGSVAPPAASPDIRFELRCQRSGDLVATIHNAGTVWA